MASIAEALRQFSKFFDPTLDLETIEDIIERIDEERQYEDEEIDTSALEELQIVKAARKRPEVLGELVDLCNECRAELDKVSINITATWETFSAFIQTQHLNAYMFCLIELGHIRPNDRIDRRLSLIAGQTYLLLQTVPGAKAFGAFHPPLIKKTLTLFELIDGIIKNHPEVREHEKIEMMINCISMMDDMRQFLGVVSLSEHVELKRAIVKAMCVVCTHYFEHKPSSKYSFQLYEKVFDVLNALCLPLHGEIVDSMKVVLNGTASINRYGPRICTPNTSSMRAKYATIGDWFVSMIDKFPKQSTEVLTLFLMAILSKPIATDPASRNMQLCVMYDRGLFRKCNVSILPYLKEDLALSADVAQRLHCVEFVSRLLIEESSDCIWGVYRSEVSLICREIGFIRILLDKLLDVSNSVKIKAINGLLRAAEGGNNKCKRIFKELFCFRPKPSASTTTTSANAESTHDTVEKSPGEEGPSKDLGNALRGISDDPTMEGIEELYEFRDSILTITRHNLTNQSALVRKATVQLLEYLASTSVSVSSFLASDEARSLHADGSSTVRRQLVHSVDRILQLHPDDAQIIDAYVRLTLDLACDDDPKVQTAVMDSFRRNIFDNIEPFEQSTSKRHMFPWRLFHAMLCGNDLPDVRACIGQWFSNNLITPRILARIESYISSSHSNEAWILLSMIASKITSRDPEHLVSELLKNLKPNTECASDNSYEQLEVLACWLDDLSLTTQNEVFAIVNDLLRSGGVVPRNVPRTYEICQRIISKASEAEQLEWKTSLMSHCRAYIMKHHKSLIIADLCNDQLINYLFVYAELLTDSGDEPTANVFDFLLSFLTRVAQKQLTIGHDATLAAKVNGVQNVLTKMSLFNYEICLKVLPVIGQLLESVNNNGIIITAIICLSDLFKKHTSLAQTVMPYLLSRTRHEYFQIRFEAIQSVVGLIMDEYIKMRGPTLVYMFAALCDTRTECTELVHELLLKYTAEKNPVFIRSCLLECPFVLNAYAFLDNMEMFASTDGSIDSPIKGVQHLASRQYVYRFLIHNMDVEYCYMFFRNLHMVMDKLKHDTANMTQPEGLAAVRDFIYILTEICVVKEKGNQKVADLAALAEDEDDGSTPATTPSTPSSAPSAAGRRKPGAPTVDQGLVIVDQAIPRIPELNEILFPLEPSFSKDIADLCTAVCQHFPTLTEYAQPKDFWQPFRKNIVIRPPSRPIPNSTSQDTLADGEPDGDSDDNDAETTAARIVRKRPSQGNVGD